MWDEVGLLASTDLTVRNRSAMSGLRYGRRESPHATLSAPDRQHSTLRSAAAVDYRTSKPNKLVARRSVPSSPLRSRTLSATVWQRATLVVAAIVSISLVVLFSQAYASGMRGVVLCSVLLKPAACMAIVSIAVILGSYLSSVLRQGVHEPDKLGLYQLKQHLGSGGMGDVYLAEHVVLKQLCAIKVIRPEQAADPNVVRRFEREVETTVRLKHSNTVKIYDYGHTEDGTFYYAMEYLPGLNLEELVKRHGPLPAPRAIHLLRQVCAALKEAHAAGLVHRDIKPANIIACETGGVLDVAKLLDFGMVKVAKRAAGDEKLTEEGIIAGTPTYMSPEQASGEEHLYATSDIYSLGAVAYYLLTARPPFVRTRPVLTIMAHLRDPVRPLTELCPKIPADLEAVVLHCLEKEPSRHFADVQSLDDALAACQAAQHWSRVDANLWWNTLPVDRESPVTV